MLGGLLFGGVAVLGVVRVMNTEERKRIEEGETDEEYPTHCRHKYSDMIVVNFTVWKLSAQTATSLILLLRPQSYVLDRKSETSSLRRVEAANTSKWAASADPRRRG